MSEDDHTHKVTNAWASAQSGAAKQGGVTSQVPGSTPVAEAALHWYDVNHRVLPWRAAAGAKPDPYHVWLSEIMLQQTTVAAVDGYFRRFVERWPTVQALAAANLDQVLQAWAGLGYYARARNLHACARAIAESHGGAFPRAEADLRRLPGVGEYTAAAVAAIAFDSPATVVDGNIERVVARLDAVTQPLPGAKPALRRAAARHTPNRRPGDYAQAMMDIGATLCTPRRPKCLLCPLSAFCEARRLDVAEQLPVKAKKAERPIRRGVAFWVIDRSGSVLLRTRPERGLLGGMTEIPSTPWKEGNMPTLEEALDAAPLRARWRLAPGIVRHTFTHFFLELTVAVGRIDLRPRDADGFWVSLDAIGDKALPSVMVKTVKHAMRHID